MPTVPLTPYFQQSSPPYADSLNKTNTRPAPVGLLFSDDFESYTPPQTIAGSGNDEFTWTGGKEISDTQAFEGDNSLLFSFGRDQAQGFELASLRTEVTIEFRLYIPSDYYHRTTGVGYEGANNKFLRIWPVNYTDVEKVGFSTGIQAGGLGESTLLVEFSNEEATSAAPAAQSTVADFITVADRGQWMNIKMQITAATASTPGYVSMYKNGSLFFERETVTRGYDEVGFGAGYLLGYANTGFEVQTLVYIDSFSISEGIV